VVSWYERIFLRLRHAETSVCARFGVGTSCGMQCLQQAPGIYGDGGTWKEWGLKRGNVKSAKSDFSYSPVSYSGYSGVPFVCSYPAADLHPLLTECHGSEIIFDWSGNF